MPVSGSFALRYPPPIPCVLLLFRTSPLSGTRCGLEAPRQRQVSCSPGTPRLPGTPTRRHLALPSFRVTPVNTCPGLKTPVVSCILAISHPGLLLSDTVDRVSFHPKQRNYPNDHNYTYFGAQYTACILDPSGFGLLSPGLPADFSTDLVANL
jgi:hypothetical protein